MNKKTLTSWICFFVLLNYYYFILSIEVSDRVSVSADTQKQMTGRPYIKYCDIYRHIDISSHKISRGAARTPRQRFGHPSCPDRICCLDSIKTIAEKGKPGRTLRCCHVGQRTSNKVFLVLQKKKWLLSLSSELNWTECGLFTSK